MSTDFLNRRMDLSHSLITTVGDTPSKSILTMDTSYPVKLAGKVIKLFTAADRYYKNMTWEIRNSIDELILTIETDHVYDFAGNVLNDSVGEGLPYGTESEVYVADDYIMAVIDFDAATLHLCSETNFKNYFHGEKGGKLKLFEIDGTDDISSDTSNFPYTTISKDEFAKAVAFENDNNETHSFMRHSDDQVLWELPEQKTEGDITNREMIPVAKVDNFNINGLNISISILMFPSINASNRYRGMENLQEFNTYYTIEGEVNEEFIKEFCYNYSELTEPDPDLDLEILQYGRYLRRYLDTIPENERNNYRYVFLRNIGVGTFNDCKRRKAPFSEKELVDDYWIIPIDKTTNKFKAYFYKSLSGALVKNEAMTLRSMVTDTRFLIGSYWEETFDGFGIIQHFDSDYSEIFRMQRGKTVYNTNNKQYIYKSFNESNRSFENSAYLTRRDTNQTTQQWYNIDSMKYVKRFINFFGNADNTYMNHFKEYTLSAPNNTLKDVGFGYLKNGSFTYQPIPVIVSMNPELFEKLLYGQNPDSYDPSNVRESCTLRNFCDINDSTVTTPDPSFDRTEYKFDSRVSIWGDTNVRYFRSVIYEVFDRLDNDLKFEYKIYDKPSSEYNFGCNIKSVHYPFVCRANQSPINNSHASILVQDTNNKNHMLTLVNCIALATINAPYYNKTKPEYNNAELAYESILVDHVIEFAKGTDSNNDHIIIENNKIYIRPNINEANRYQLFTVADTNTSNPNNTFEFRELTPSNFKNSTSHTKGLDYYYYDKDGEIRRIKYFYNEADSKSSVALYDYYVDSKLFSKTDDVLPTDGTFYDFNVHVFIKAYIGAYIADFNETYQQAIASWNSHLSDNWKDLVLTTIKHYKFFPYNLTSEDNRMVYEKFANNLNNEFRSNTCDLTDSFDYKLLSALTPNESTLHEGNGALLSDFVKGYALHADCRAPYVSNTEVNGSTIYNVASYIDYLKHKPIDDIFDVDSFRYLNGAGIRKEYYYDDKNKKYRSLYQFYQYCMSRNLEYPISDPRSILKSDSLSMATAIYNRDSISAIKRNPNDNSSKFYTLDGGVYKPYTLNSKLLAYMPVDSQNVFGYNQITLYNDDTDFSVVNSVYESDNVLYISKIQTGVYTIFDISMNDGNPINSSILNVNGVLGTIEVDTVNWSTLLLALNNNKTIDLLSTSLITIKNQLNTYILDNTQNINSNITTAENNAVEVNANSHDTIYDEYPDSELYKEKNAVYDRTHDIYIFNYGYGFREPATPVPGVSQERVINNRGIIVFETDGFKTYQYRNSAQDSPKDYWYKTVEGTIYPKRMHISGDGIVCTKELIDAENMWGETLLQKLGLKDSNGNIINN